MPFYWDNHLISRIVHRALEYIEFGEEGHRAYKDMSMRTRTFKLLLDFFNQKLKRKEAA